MELLIRNNRELRSAGTMIIRMRPMIELTQGVEESFQTFNRMIDQMIGAALKQHHIPGIAQMILKLKGFENGHVELIR